MIDLVNGQEAQKFQKKSVSWIVTDLPGPI